MNATEGNHVIVIYGHSRIGNPSIEETIDLSCIDPQYVEPVASRFLEGGGKPKTSLMTGKEFLSGINDSYAIVTRSSCPVVGLKDDEYYKIFRVEAYKDGNVIIPEKGAAVCNS